MEAPQGGETVSVASPRQVVIPCCVCGKVITPNAANQCSACLASEFSLESIVQSDACELTILQCRKCRRFQHAENPKVFSPFELESPELMALCLKHIPALQSGHRTSAGVSDVKLVDAMWVWTEPHCMRLKLRATVRATASSVLLQQRVLVHFRIRFTQCVDCNRVFTNRTWDTVLQLRQKRSQDRKGLVLLEMAIAKHDHVRRHVLNVDTSRHGFDFYFSTPVHAQTFASYIGTVAPMKITTSSKMVSEDVKNNTAHVKHTLLCELVPLCRDDLVLIDRRRSNNNASISLTGRMALVVKMSSAVHFVDACPPRGPDGDASLVVLHPEKYYKAGGEKSFRVLKTGRSMVRFVVLDVELCNTRDSIPSHGNLNADCGGGKYALANVEVARESDFGKKNDTFYCTTHLGNLLQVGDIVLGYDLASAVLPDLDREEEGVRHALNASFVMPDVVLVKKVQGNAGTDTDAKNDEKRGRAKSSGSKKRERRNRKHEKKQKSLNDTAARMGFLDIGDDGNDQALDDAIIMEEERDAFEREMENDPELALELELAEKELARMNLTPPDDEVTTHDDDDNDDETNLLDL